MNYYGRNGIKFLFIVDFEMKFPVIMELAKTKGSGIKYFIDGADNYSRYADNMPDKNELKIQKNPVPFEVYKKAFNNVIKHEKAGNSYLVNLTFKSPVTINLGLLKYFIKAALSINCILRILFKNSSCFPQKLLSA